MAFQPGLIQGAGAAGRARVDYRLARRNLVAAFRRGRVARTDICDPHPELVRAATNLGQPLSQPCPICEAEELVLVRYVFGPRLPKSGRCVADNAELAKLADTEGSLDCYVVEVCRDCGWNHLAERFAIGRGTR